MSRFFGVDVAEFNENATNTGFGFRPDFSGGFSGPPFWAVVTNWVVSGTSLVSQGVVVLIARGLEGDFSARTLMWMQAIFECFKRILSIIMTCYSTSEFPNNNNMKER